MEHYQHKIIPIDSIQPYEFNPREHEEFQVDQIAASIKEFGFTNPILIDEEYNLIAGHGRLYAATKLELAELPAMILTNLTQTQKQALVIADNQLAMNSQWNFELLNQEIEKLKADDFNIDLLGFDDDFMSDLAEMEMVVDEGLTDEDSVPEPPAQPVTKLGDIWLLGDHRLMCGDSTSIDEVERLMDGNKADMWITDPPYNVGYTGGTKDKMTIQNDDMDDSSFRQFLIDSYSAADAVMRSGAVFYIWHAIMETINFMGAAKDVGWKVRQILIWNKGSLSMGRFDYHWKHEPCLYGWKEGASHLWCSDRKQSTVLEFAKPNVNDLHPTMKPVELIEYQIRNNTKIKNHVLDSFCGSGTTLIASQKTNRKCYGMELDPKYCDVIINRWQDYTGSKATLESSGESYGELKEQLEQNLTPA